MSGFPTNQDTGHNLLHSLHTKVYLLTEHYAHFWDIWGNLKLYGAFATLHMDNWRSGSSLENSKLLLPVLQLWQSILFSQYSLFFIQVRETRKEKLNLHTLLALDHFSADVLLFRLALFNYIVNFSPPDRALGLNVGFLDWKCCSVLGQKAWPWWAI